MSYHDSFEVNDRVRITTFVTAYNHVACPGEHGTVTRVHQDGSATVRLDWDNALQVVSPDQARKLMPWEDLPSR